MTERPIIFSGPMVRAILEGKKNQTRRVIKPQPVQSGTPSGPIYDQLVWNGYALNTQGMCDHIAADGGPYGQPGDLLWVRETWAPSGLFWFAKPRETKACDDFRYRAADGPRGHLGGTGARWRSPMHMPKWACRLWLRIVSVRVERLQEITPADARAEGVTGDAEWEWVIKFERAEAP